MMKKIPFYSLLSLSILMLISNSSSAQDTIFMKNDQRIPATILEVSSTEVKYKRFEVNEGPVYIERKSMISKIKYKNGFVDVFSLGNAVDADEYRVVKQEYKVYEQKEQPKYPNLSEWGRGKYMYGEKIIGERQLHRTLLSLNDIKITEQVMNAKQSKALKYIGFAAIPLGIASVVYAIRAEDVYFFYSRSASAYTRDRYRKNSWMLAGGAAVCIGTSIFFGVDRKKKNRMAIQLYQEHYAKK